MLLDNYILRSIFIMLIFIYFINLYKDYYIGNYLNYKYDGLGKLYSYDGKLKYEGEFVLGKVIGYGTKYRNDGSIDYKGNFVLGMKHGYGTLYDRNNKIIYEGRFSHNKKLKI